MIESMLMAGKSGEIFNPPVVRQLTMSNLDISTIATKRPMIMKDSTYCYLVHPDQYRVYRAQLDGLSDGKLDWVAGSLIGNATLMMGHNHGPVDPLANGDFVYLPGGTNHYLRRLIDPTDPASIPTMGTVSLQPDYAYTHGVAQAVVGDTLYYFGGYTQQTPRANMDVWAVIDQVPYKDSVGSLPSDRAYHSSGTYGTDIYALGGLLVPVNNTYPVSNELWRYDTVTHVWQRLPDCPYSVRIASNIVFVKDHLCVYGGCQTGDTSSTIPGLLVYSILDGTWAMYPIPSIGARLVPTLFVNKGKIYLTGGYLKAPFPSDLWEFTV